MPRRQGKDEPADAVGEDLPRARGKVVCIQLYALLTS